MTQDIFEEDWSEDLLFDFENDPPIDPPWKNAKKMNLQFKLVARYSGTGLSPERLQYPRSCLDSVDRAKDLLRRMEEFQAIPQKSSFFVSEDFLEARQRWESHMEKFRELIASIGPLHVALMEDYRWTYKLYRVAHTFNSGSTHDPAIFRRLNAAQEQFFVTPTVGELKNYIAASQQFRSESYYEELTAWMKKFVPEKFPEFQKSSENSLLDLEALALWEDES